MGWLASLLDDAVLGLLAGPAKSEMIMNQAIDRNRAKKDQIMRRAKAAVDEAHRDDDQEEHSEDSHLESNPRDTKKSTQKEDASKRNKVALTSIAIATRALVVLTGFARCVLLPFSLKANQTVTSPREMIA